MPKLYRHLPQDQRCQIYALRKRGIAQAGIASDLGINQSTSSRELSRNKGLWGYRFLQAQRFSEEIFSARVGCGSTF